MHFRFFVALALLGASVLWLGASPPSLPPPTVVVFPLTVNGDADKESGSRLATLFAQQLADNGVKVVPPPPGTERTDFLATARKIGADYYVSGFVTPLGAEVTVVEQIVSTISGTVIASNSAQLLTYSDAAGQGAILAASILRHAGRALASLGESPPSTTPAPKESNEANLGGLGKIFKRKPKAAPSPSPSAVAAASSTPPRPQTVASTQTLPPRTAAPQTPAPTRRPSAAPTLAAAPPPGASNRILLFDVGGTAAADRRRHARTDLQGLLAKAGQTVAVAGPIDPQEIRARASELCAQNGAKALVDSELATRDGDQTYGPNTIAQLDVRAVDCNGRVLLQQRFERDGTGRKNWERAIDNAVAAASGPLERALR